MPRHTENRASIIFIIPRDQRDRLKVLAKRHNQTLSDLIREAIAEYARREYLEDIAPEDLTVSEPTA